VSDTEDTNPRVRSPLQDPEHEAILVHFEHRVDLLFSQLKEWIGEQLRETNSGPIGSIPPSIPPEGNGTMK
jgi:hypothetical protein